MVSVCHVAMQDHVTILPNLMTIGTVVVVLVCHMNL